MSRVAVLSDIHGNAVALDAVLADAAAAGVDAVLVAGDSVNFGPDSDAVVDRLRAHGAHLIRGNHEVELVATYGTPAMPPALAAGASFGLTRLTLEQLGPERRAFLTALPDRLALDEATLVVHGSPRHVRDAVLERSTDAELRAMFAGETARLAFVGHTHRPLLRDLPPEAQPGDGPARRLVNVGAVGFNLDGDTRAAYALAERGTSGTPGDWRVEIRRVPYDVAAAVAAFDRFRPACPELTEVFARQVGTARSYFGPWLRSVVDVPEGQRLVALRRFLQEHP